MNSADSRRAERNTIAPAPDEQVVYRVDDRVDSLPDEHRRLDAPATIAGALAALGTLVLLASALGAVVGTIGYQTGVDNDDLSLGGLVAGLAVLLVACLVGGWVTGRTARRNGSMLGLVAIVWLFVLAGLIALAAHAADDLDVTDRVGLPRWFSRDSLSTEAIVTGVVAALLMLVGGWLGGRVGARPRHNDAVSVVQTRRAVREHDGGIVEGRGV